MAMPSLAAATSGTSVPITGFYEMAGEGNPWAFVVRQSDVASGTPGALAGTANGNQFVSSSRTGSWGDGFTTSSASAVSVARSIIDYWLHAVFVDSEVYDILRAGDDVSGSFVSGGTTYSVTYSEWD